MTFEGGIYTPFFCYQNIDSFSTHTLLRANMFLWLLCPLDATATFYSIGATSREQTFDPRAKSGSSPGIFCARD